MPDQPDPFAEDAITELLRKLSAKKRLEGMSPDEIQAAVSPEMRAALAVRLKECGEEQQADGFATPETVLRQQGESRKRRPDSRIDDVELPDFLSRANPPRPPRPDLPAFGLIATSAFGLYGTFVIVMNAPAHGGVLSMIIGLCGTLCYGVTVVGAVYMWRMHNYYLALAASIIPIVQMAAVPALALAGLQGDLLGAVLGSSVGACLSLFFSVFALSILLRNDVHNAFKHPRPTIDNPFTAVSKHNW